MLLLVFVRLSEAKNLDCVVISIFKIVAASLEARGAFKIVACFLHHGNSKVCL